MTELIAEAAAAQAPASMRSRKAKKPRVAPRGAHVAPQKGKTGKKASSAKKARPEARRRRLTPANGSKTAKVLELLRRPGGVTAKELMKATGWQPHSVHGFLSGTVGKKMGLTVTSTKAEDGERTYSVKA